ncbi:ParA family protein [Ectopseudomonas mendocina]|uniref:ParA family protein n=1 Tax=Ectopseudomonas mendocina TaxID=300 RepID=A0A379PP37_ECTME|nr:AAA family ATPase [Pseudomonas mendocina]SUE95839.1 ParA family protein [Pseudomonas mendocina]
MTEIGNETELLAIEQSMGTKSAGLLFEQFAVDGNADLDAARTIITHPEDRKLARTWGINEAAPMIGRSISYIRQNEAESVRRDEQGRWHFTLEDINRLREKYGTLYKRPAGSKAMILAISNFKGGVAKTTTCIHLAQKAAMEGLRVLVVDLDPQASTTFNLGSVIPDIEVGKRDIINDSMIIDPQMIHNAIVHTYFHNIHLIPSNLHLQELDVVLPNSEANNSAELGHPAYRLANALEVISNDYDLIILDCGPNMASVSVNAMTACNGLIVPLPPQTFDHASFVMLSSSLASYFKATGKELDYLRLLITKHPGSQSKGAALIEQKIRRMYGSYVLNNVVSMTAEIQKASSEMSTVYDQAANKNSRRTYQRAIEILDAVNNEIIGDLKIIWARQAREATNS